MADYLAPITEALGAAPAAMADPALPPLAVGSYEALAGRLVTAGMPEPASSKPRASPWPPHPRWTRPHRPSR